MNYTLVIREKAALETIQIFIYHPCTPTK